MARSLRSKRRRKLMAIKRQRYGKKELIRLKKMLGLPTGEEVSVRNSEVKVETDVSEITTVVSSDEVQHIEQPNEDQDQDWEEMDDDIAEVIKMKRKHKMRKSHRPEVREGGKPRSLRRKEKGAPVGAGEGEGEEMDHDQRRRYSRKTQRDQFGNYPEWMNQKTVKQLAKKSKKIKRLEKKQQYKRSCKSGQRKYSKRTIAADAAGVNEAIIGFKKIGVVETTALPLG